MKVKGILIIFIFAFCGNSSSILAQSSVIGAVSATVVQPIAITKNVDMNFGNAAVSASTGGSLILTPSGTRTTGGAGVTLPATAGTIAAAGFTVSGAPGYTYAITLPASTVINGPGSASMSVSSFTSAPSATGTLGSGGTQSIAVGATLYIAAAQAPGNYTNATALPVTVNYN